MALTTAQIQQAYVTFFSRPADPVGLAYWQNYSGSVADLYATFAQQAEYSAAFSGLTSAQKVNVVYQNLFGRDAEATGLLYWAGKIESGAITVANLALAVSAGSQGTDKVTVDSRVSAATSFTAALDTPAEILGYTGATANAAAKTWLAGVTTAANLATAVAAIDTAAAGVVAVGGAAGSTFTLTTGVDTFVGTASGDTFNAVNTSSSAVLGGLDSIDGGAGVDSFNVSDTATAANADLSLPTGFSVKNVEKISVSTNGAIGTPGGTAFDVSGATGLTSFSGVAVGAGTNTGSSVKVAGTTDVALTVSGNNTITIVGGKAVTTTSAAAGTGAVGVTGSALTSVTVNGGGTATIDNESTAAVSATGTTLTSVTLNNDATGAIKGAALATVSLSGQGAGGTARTVTLTNGTSKALTINANGTGYQNNAAATEKQTVFTQATATATSVTVNTTAKSSLDLTGITTLTSVALTGAGNLTFKPMGSSVLSLDGSAATGNLTLGTLDAALVTVKTGAGNDTAQLSATTKATVDTGAGNDTLTLGAALAAGSTINLGAGNDTLSGTTAVAASSGTNVTVIDAGDGVDSVSSGLITAGNAAQFKNFENVSIQASVDASLLTASTITGLTIDGSTGTSVVSGITQAQGLTVKANNGGTSSSLTFTGVTGTADAYSIGFAATTTGTAASPTSIDAKIVEIEGIENVTINSASAAGVVTNAVALKGTTGRTVTINGDQALNLTFDTAFGNTTAPKTGVSLIDGSAATGKLGVTLTNVVAATAGLTVKGGSADDTITTIASQATTLTGGAGKDNFVVGATVYGGSAYVTTITDFANSGDKITFKDKGTETWTSAKKDVSAATTLATALGIAIGNVDGSSNGAHSWFQYGGNTYIVENMTSAAVVTDANSTDLVVKLTGLIDLSTATFAAGGSGATLTLA